jgi:methionyl-tRNA formyltransferase
MSASPVKARALAAGIPIFQPEKLRRPDAVSALASLEPDLIVVAAYAQILSRNVLGLPGHGCLNVHGSLLPRYRGASPIQAAILDGADDTGISIMLMDEGLDTGPVLTQARTSIEQVDTSATLSGKLALAGARLLAETIPQWVMGAIEPQPQDDAMATVTERLRKTDGKIDWADPAERIARQVRAMNPWPGAYSYLHGLQVKLIAAHVVPGSHDGGRYRAGTIVDTNHCPTVVTGKGGIVLDTVQPAGKRAMAGAEWLRGMPRAVGSTFRDAGEP